MMFKELCDANFQIGVSRTKKVLYYYNILLNFLNFSNVEK